MLTGSENRETTPSEMVKWPVPKGIGLRLFWG
jgi:hypothetical protein